MSCCVRFYKSLNDRLVQKIMFKNKKNELEQLKKEHAQGGTEIKTELENIMLAEAKELLRDRVENLEGRRQLHEFCTRRKSGGSKKRWYEHSFFKGVEKKVKLKNMQRTFEFVSGYQLLIRFIETLFYIIISNTQNVIYSAMIFSMYQNVGACSVIYPIMVFGYGLLEEAGPTRGFWELARQYTTALLILKFVLNIQEVFHYLNALVGGSLPVDGVDDEGGEGNRYPWYLHLAYTVKVGFHHYENIGDTFVYMLPEIVIITFLMLHEIK